MKAHNWARCRLDKSFSEWLVLCSWLLGGGGGVVAQNFKCGYYVNKRRDLGIFLKDLRLQKAEGKFMGRVVLTLFQLFLPLIQGRPRDGSGGGGGSGSFGDPPEPSEEPGRAGAPLGG